MKLSMITTTLLLSLLMSTIMAGVPLHFNFQGRLTDDVGNSMPNDVYRLLFTIWHDPASLDPNDNVWNSGLVDVTTSDGLFTVNLGEAPMTVLDPFIFVLDSNLWLGVSIDPEPEHGPRVKLSSMPYAIMSRFAQNAMEADSAGFAVDASALNGQGPSFYLDWNNLIDVPVGFADGVDDAGSGWNWSDSSSHGADSVLFADSSDHADNATNANFADSTDAITDGGVDFADVGQNGAVSGQVMKWNGKGWVAAADDVSGGGSGGGWTDAGTVVRLDATADSVGIGTSTPSEKLEVMGNISISGKATIGQGHTNTGAAGFVVGESNVVTGKHASVSGGSSNSAGGVSSAVGGGFSNSASGPESVVSGGSLNTAAEVLSTVAGGSLHWAGGVASTVSGGVSNVASGHASTVAGGWSNTTTGDSSVVSGGNDNAATGLSSTVSGGRIDTASGEYSTVGGGRVNAASAYSATVSGGSGNTASGNYSTVSGGNGNVVNAASSTISGGNNNAVTGVFSALGGGNSNTASGSYSAIGGGRDHTAVGQYSFIGGGANNTASGDSSVIGGGGNNHADASFSTIGGGRDNTITGHGSTIGGGLANTVTDSAWAFIGGGSENDAIANHTVISGGYFNTASGVTSSVVGGIGNTASGDASFVGGGSHNSAQGLNSTVAGGNVDTASGVQATVGGGWRNVASGDISTITGGKWNTASGELATIGGGTANEATGNYSTIAGGASNTSAGADAMVAGGSDNSASGYASVVAGGTNNSADGKNSFAAGQRAQAIHDGCFVWGDIDAGYVSSFANFQFIARSKGGVRFYTNSALTTGVWVSAGGGSWSSISDSTVKENIRSVDGENILEKISQLDITRWNYESQDASIEHIGPMAQDFHRLFGVGDNNTTITTVDPDGISLAAIKALYEKSKRIDELESELAELRRLVEELIANQK